MRERGSHWVVLQILVTACCVAAQSQPQLNLMPMPASVQASAGQLSIARSFSVAITGSHDASLDTAVLPLTPGYSPKGDANALAQWEYCFDRADTDTSRGNYAVGATLYYCMFGHAPAKRLLAIVRERAGK